MKILCIDVGNTNLHYGIVDKKTITNSGNFPTRNFQKRKSTQFTAIIAESLKEVAGISVCSVVPAIDENLFDSIRPFGLPIFHLTHKNCVGLKLAYPKPEEIGQDRIANAIASQQYYKLPAVILDMGTAVTFDVISSSGYEGGIIAPGLAIMTRYLHEQTALLPKLSEQDLLNVEGAIGKSTVHAMKLGVSIGFSGMLDALLTRVLAELEKRGEAPPVVLTTGGSIANLTSEWSQKSEFIEDLTLIGLATAFERQT